jgi:hypothetical protein
MTKKDVFATIISETFLIPKNRVCMIIEEGQNLSPPGWDVVMLEDEAQALLEALRAEAEAEGPIIWVLRGLLVSPQADNNT